jgi:hypothetical protein
MVMKSGVGTAVVTWDQLLSHGQAKSDRGGEMVSQVLVHYLHWCA